MSGRGIWFADLTHTAQGISAATFPLGVSFVLSYAKAQLGNEYDYRLFKFPSDLDRALRAEQPAFLCLSNYSWNFELAYRFASVAKGQYPELVTVFGGPNFPTLAEEKSEFLTKRPAIDFYVELEGEVGFVDLVRKLKAHGFKSESLKERGETAANTSYIWNGELVSGPVERILDVNIIPSPYLTGILDDYFSQPLVPMIETTRGCPFSCTFCADGIPTKNKVARFDIERTKEELNYVASRVKDVDELIVTDLNFAMYQHDVVTAKAIREIQDRFNYPKLFSASAGKNKPKRTIEVAGIIDGWTLGASIQSTDPEVLSAIKRSNISSAAYQELIDYGNSIKTSKTHSEIILGLPGDTKEKHFESLRFGIDNNVNSLRMFQAMLLSGTEMADRQTRKQYSLITKFRTIPGCLGVYEILGQQHPVAEIEEIIVGSESLPVKDYLDCRAMNLIVETFHNNAMFEEIFSMVRAMGVSPFECLLYIKEHPKRYPPAVQDIFDQFLAETADDLFDTFEEANTYVLTPEILNRYIGGELGTNELLVHRALLFNELEAICGILIMAIKETLKAREMLTPQTNKYLDNLKDFTILRKQRAFFDTESTSSSTFDFDFEAIQQADFYVDPNELELLDTPLEYSFFHDAEQLRHIGNQVKIYSNTPIGLGRLIQRSNLKLIFRQFARTKKPVLAAGTISI